MRRGFAPGLLAIILLPAALRTAQTTPANDPWEGPPFSASPAALLKAAAEIPVNEGIDVVVLLDENRYVFDAEGRETRTRRLVSRMVTKAGVNGWSNTHARWAPWHQQRPVARARVVTADGRVHPLDPKTIAEVPVANDAPEIFTDARSLEGPLPAVAPGSILEEEWVIRDTSPFYDQGTVTTVGFGYGKGALVRKVRLVLDAPASLPLRYKMHDLPGPNPRREEVPGRVRWTFEATPGETDLQTDAYAPYEVRQWPQVSFSTGKSWNDVARRYHEIVEAQIRGADLRRFLPAGPEKGEPREVAARLLARLREEIRYAAVEFGDAAIVPRQPAEVMQRRYGDCKDQASLMVALLRASGLPAQVALINVASRRDPDPDLPGMGQFDHAIVYLPGSPALWMDPTDHRSPAGEIPAAEQGRLALVAAPDTTGLIRTPESSSADNRQLETRDFYLPENGPARVVETTDAWGTRAQDYRGLTPVENKKLKEHLADYVKRAYVSDEVARVEPPAAGFGLPARLVIETGKSKRGYTAPLEAAVYVRLESAVAQLPAWFHEEESDQEKKRPRQKDLLLPEAFTHEVRYRIHPPLGYVARPLPSADTKTFGQATLTQEHKVESDGSVTAIVRFDTGPRRMPAKDAEALRAGVRELTKSNAVTISFEQKGMALLEAGKTREALAEFRMLVEKHPKEALHHGQVARALLAAGLGEAARAQARRAVELESKSALAYRTLASILEHDLLGRQFKKGFDHAGAEAAHRQALELDPEDHDARFNFAVFLEHNPEGVRYGRDAKLKEAITHYQALAKQLEGTNLANNLPIALLRNRQFKEARDLLKATPTNNLRLAAIAAAEGSASAIREANVMGETARQQHLAAAGDLLLRLRLYSEAGDLLAAAAKGSSTAAAVLGRANLIKQLRRSEDMPLPPDDPKSAVQRLFMVMFGAEVERVQEAMVQVVSSHGHDALKDPDEIEKLQRTVRQMRAAFRSSAIPDAAAVDLILGSLQISVEGDASTGFRVRTTGFGAESRPSTFFVIQEQGQLRLLDEGADADTVGREILERAEKGDLAGASRLLDWIRAEQEPAGGDDPLAGKVFPRFWTRGAKGDRAAIQVAAAALLVNNKLDSRAIPLLKKELDRAASDATRHNLLLALAQAYAVRQQASELAPVAESLWKAYPTSATAFAMLSGALAEQGRWKEVRRIAEERLKRLPDDLPAVRSLAHVAMAEQNYKEAEQLSRRATGLSKSNAGDWNQLGWQALYHPPVSDALFAEVQRGIGNTNEYAILHTLAMLYAEMGRASEARDVLWQAMDAGGMEEPDSSAWLVLGRVAEHFEAREAAVAAYRKVEKPKRQAELSQSNYLLAQRRLAALATEPRR